MTTATIQPAAWCVSMGTTADHNYWHYFGKKPKSIDDGEIWEPLYSASTLESLQRENAELRKDKDHIAAEKAGIAKNAHNNVEYWKSQAEAAEAEVKRLQAEIDRKSSMPGDHRYWEGRYREEAEDNELMRSVLRPMAEVAGDVSESWPDDAQVVTEIGHFRRARAALASTGGEHHAE